ncbi:magnesium transporter MgtE, partial [bacterium]|nr:magnesium transporter MgtE [bacterium]
VTLQAMHKSKPTLLWMIGAARKEFVTSVLLGSACGLLVGMIVLTWKHDWLAALSIGGSVFLSTISACLLGVLIPAFSRVLKLDPKIAAGPLTLAIADICTLSCYFGLAKMLYAILA